MLYTGERSFVVEHSLSEHLLAEFVDFFPNRSEGGSLWNVRGALVE